MSRLTQQPGAQATVSTPSPREIYVERVFDAALDRCSPHNSDADPGPPWGTRCRHHDNVVCYTMTHHGLGEFEQLVLLAIVHLRGEAYGVPIVEEIERRTGRSVARAAVYVTLRRLEEKRFVSSWMGDPTPERGGKARRYVKLEADGVSALREARKTADRMWQGLDPASLTAR